MAAIDRDSNVQSFEGRVALVQLLREARRLRDIGGAVAFLDSMSRATGDILQKVGLIDQAHAGLFYDSVQEMKADMRTRVDDLANLSIEDLGLFAHPSRTLRLGTIHFSKGREYKGVASINLRERTFPHYYSQDIEADKRLFYVGVTRAERVLVYIAEPDRFGNPPSRFLRQGGLRLC